MKSHLLYSCLLILLPAAACAQFPPATTPYGPATIHGCYDGDTCTISIPSLPSLFGDRLPIRLAGIDTPEIKGHCPHEKALALRARAYVRERLLDAQHVEITPVARDKYFRVLSIITVDGADLADGLLAAGLAIQYGGGTKMPWCAAAITPLPPE